MLYKKYQYNGQTVGVAAVGYGPKIWHGYFQVERADSTYGNSLPGQYASKEEAMDAALAEGRSQVDLYVPIRMPTRRLE